MDMHHWHAATASSDQLRGWLTFAWAIIVGTGTLVGVYAAVSNYLSSLWEQQVNAARKVYLVGSKIYSVNSGEDIGRPDGIRLGKSLQEIGHASNAMVWRALIDLQRMVVDVRNDSDEPMGDLYIMGLTGDGEVSFRYPIPPLMPSGSGQYDVLMPGDYAATVIPEQLFLEYTDSAGNRWQRRETDPPRPFTKRTRKQIRQDRKPVQPDPYMS